MDKNPYEPSSDARQNAASLYDQYRSYVDAGFTETQAMQIICTERAAMISAGITHFLNKGEEK